MEPLNKAQTLASSTITERLSKTTGVLVTLALASAISACGGAKVANPDVGQAEVGVESAPSLEVQNTASSSSSSGSSSNSSSSNDQSGHNAAAGNDGSTVTETTVVDTQPVDSSTGNQTLGNSNPGQPAPTTPTTPDPQPVAPVVSPEPTAPEPTVAPIVEPEPTDPELSDPEPTDPVDDADQKPGIRLTYPESGSQYEEGAAIEVGAAAWDSDGDITKVVFFANNKWLGTSTSRPFNHVWQNAESGNHKVFAMAYDNNDLTAKSSVHDVVVDELNVANSEPTIALTLPTDVSDYIQGNSISIKANAADGDGTVTKVDFFRGTTKLGTDFNSPYEFNWANPWVGGHDIHAVATDNQGATAASATHRVTVAQNPVSASLATYPVPAAVSNQHKSNRFAVSVTQAGTARDSFVYQENNKSDPSWHGNLDYMQDANHWTTFSFSGSVQVEARRLDGKAIGTCVIRPKVLKIEPIIAGNKCTFTLNKAAKVSVEIDENTMVSQYIDKIGNLTKHIVKHPLFVFADPMEADIPSAGDPNVVYFGPGVHRIGKRYAIPDNTTVYLAGGAYVVGTFIALQRHPQNVTIRGRGILSGTGLGESTDENLQWQNHAIDFTEGGGGKNVLIEGITITDPLRSCIVSYSQTDIRNVKLFSWRHRNDGIASGNNSIIEDNFLKVQDDNIKLYFSNQIVRNNVIWQQTSGAVFKFAWELKRVAQNNSVYNIDIIHSNVFFDYPVSEPDRPDLNSTSAIFSAMGFNKNAAFKNNTFQWIRIEEENLLRLMSLRMVSTHQTDFAKSVWGNPNESASKVIDNIRIDDLSLAGVPYKASTFYGNKGGVIKKVWLSNLKIDGQLIPSKGQFTSRLDGVGMISEGSVSNILIQ